MSSKDLRMCAISKHSKLLILRVAAYFDDEKHIGQPLIPFERSRDRACAALGISIKTLSRIMREEREGGVKSPKPRVKRKKSITAKEKYDENAIRKTIYEICDSDRNITLRTIYQELKSRNLFIGSQTSLFRILRDMKFSWKIEDNVKYFLENNVPVKSNNKLVKKSIPSNNFDRATNTVSLQQIKHTLFEQPIKPEMFPNTCLPFVNNKK